MGKRPKYTVSIGDKFGQLTVEQIINNSNIYCKCICGCIKKYTFSHLKRLCTMSCGCLTPKIKSEKKSKHRLSNTRLYQIFNGIKTRCYNENSEDYKTYGGKGIKICQEWLDNFLNFYNWSIANGYQDNLSIDRKNNDGDYCPENCRWTTQYHQSRNTSRTISITAFGETKVLKDWSTDIRCKISEVTLLRRIKNGMNPELAITLSKQKTGPKKICGTEEN